MAPLLRVKKDMFASGSCLFPKSFLGHQIERYRANGTTPSPGSLGELEPSFLKQAEPSEIYHVQPTSSCEGPSWWLQYHPGHTDQGEDPARSLGNGSGLASCSPV